MTRAAKGTRRLPEGIPYRKPGAHCKVAPLLPFAFGGFMRLRTLTVLAVTALVACGGAPPKSGAYSPAQGPTSPSKQEARGERDGDGVLDDKPNPVDESSKKAMGAPAPPPPPPQ